MSRARKLLESARNSQNNFSFADLCALAEAAGYVFRRQKGSHRIYKHPGVAGILNLQEANDGKAKPAQVRQLLGYINEHDLIK